MIKCITCKTHMKCVSDVVQEGLRLDFVECPKCKSSAEIEYGNNGEYIEKVIWKR